MLRTCSPLLFGALIFLAPDAHADEPKLSFDPLDDGALLGMSLALGFVAQEQISVGAIRPKQIDSRFTSSDLPFLDRFALGVHIDPSATTVSTIGDSLALGFAVLHPVIDGLSHGKNALFVDAAIYAETVSLTSTLGVITRLAVRRPRPIAYMHRDDYIAHGGDAATYYDDKVDDTLSFYSGHVASCAAITAAASYLLFLRYKKNDIRPWLALGVGTALTTFVAIERVRSGNHFPTDTMVGAAVGAGTGLLVVQVHREDAFPRRSLWVGATPSLDRAGGTLSVSGIF